MEDVESLSRKEACSFTVHDTGLRHMRATPYSGLAMAAAVAASIENVLNRPTSSLLLAGRLLLLVRRLARRGLARGGRGLLLPWRTAPHDTRVSVRRVKRSRASSACTLRGKRERTSARAAVFSAVFLTGIAWLELWRRGRAGGETVDF
jgi:hypothetical protein